MSVRAPPCEPWNNDVMLTDELGSFDWFKNDIGRGYKVLQVVRTNCEGSTPAELRISPSEGKATCVYGGKRETSELDTGADYQKPWRAWDHSKNLLLLAGRLHHCTLPKDLSILPAGGSRPAMRHP